MFVFEVRIVVMIFVFCCWNFLVVLVLCEVGKLLFLLLLLK